jgi:hypothetical protein
LKHGKKRKEKDTPIRSKPLYIRLRERLTPSLTFPEHGFPDEYKYRKTQYSAGTSHQTKE